eukprot:UN00122
MSFIILIERLYIHYKMVDARPLPLAICLQGLLFNVWNGTIQGIMAGYMFKYPTNYYEYR